MRRVFDPIPSRGGECLCMGCGNAAIVSDHVSSQDATLSCLGPGPLGGSWADLEWDFGPLVDIGPSLLGSSHFYIPGTILYFFK